LPPLAIVWRCPLAVEEYVSVARRPRCDEMAAVEPVIHARRRPDGVGASRG
jgi:hypothetical protein